MQVDLHVHSDVSPCSRYDRRDLLEDLISMKIKIATVTDHGSVECCRWLAERTAADKILFGVEVSSHEGDFLVFSADPLYFDTVGLYVKSVSNITRDNRTAVVWAHPRVGAPNGWKAPSYSNPQTRHVLDHIDAIEQFNGNMLALAAQGLLSADYEDSIADMAQRSGIALTGGSDAHIRGDFFRAWTQFPDDADTVTRIVEAIKDRAITPAKAGAGSRKPEENNECRLG